MRADKNERDGATRAVDVAPVGMAVGVAVLIILAPGGLAAPAHLLLTPPYTRSASNSGAATYMNCGKASGSVATWKGATGVAKGASKVSYRSCPYVGEYAQGQADSWVSVAMPFTVPKSAYYNASMTFTWAESSAMSVIAGKCPKALNYSNGYDNTYCDWFVEWYLGASTSLFDVTTGVTVSESYNYWQVGNYTAGYTANTCDNGTCSIVTSTDTGSLAYAGSYQVPSDEYTWTYASPGSSSGSGSLWTNTTSWNGHTGTSQLLSPSDRYQFVSTFYFGTYGDEYAFEQIFTGSVYKYILLNPGGSAGVSVTGQPLGDGVRVTSVNISAV